MTRIRHEDHKTVRASVPLQFPLTIIQRTDVTGLEPSRNTMEVECVLIIGSSQLARCKRCTSSGAYVTDPPGGIALFVSGRHLVGLTLDTYNVDSGHIKIKLVVFKSDSQSSMMWFLQMAQLSTTISWKDGRVSQAATHDQ